MSNDTTELSKQLKEILPEEIYKYTDIPHKLEQLFEKWRDTHTQAEVERELEALYFDLDKDEIANSITNQTLTERIATLKRKKGE